MAGEDIYSWSTTAASNGSADTSINWQEGQARASVNNSARSMMAAHAKNRNLQNGSIVTTGSANAQAFSSGAGYTAIPTNMRVLLTTGFSNTDVATLNMDGIGDVVIKDQDGNDISTGALIADQYVELLYNGTNWILLQQSVSGAVPQCGRLLFVSSTLLSYLPFNGDQIKINGSAYQIPTTGVAGLANTNVFVEGIALQNLAASTLYYVYAFNNSGTVTADFSTTTHATSTTTGNGGVEIKSAGDNTRTLIGMIKTGASSEFTFTSQIANVISWFNRRTISVKGPAVSASTTSTTAIEIDTNARVYFCTWGDEAVIAGLQGGSNNSVSGSTNYTDIGIDGNISKLTTVSTGSSNMSSSTSNASHGLFATGLLAEGAHLLSPLAFVNSGAGGFFIALSGAIRG